MSKRYYWLKLKDDFFDSLRIKKLRSIAGGDTYTIIYLKMQLKAMKKDGIIEYSGIEKTLAEEIALDIDEDATNVGLTLNYLESVGLCDIKGDDIFLPYAVENTGSETASTQRSRECRARKVLQCNNNATLLQQPCNVEKEIEKEIEIEKDLIISKDIIRQTDVRLICDKWNEIGVNPISKLSTTSQRYKMLMTRIKEYSVDEVIQAIENIKDSNFLKGGSKKGWTITFDWFVKPNNFPKVLEGQYSDSKGGASDGLEWDF